MTGTSLVQWLRFCTSKAAGPDSFPGQGTGFCRLQLRTGLQSSKLKKKKGAWMNLFTMLTVFCSSLPCGRLTSTDVSPRLPGPLVSCWFLPTATAAASQRGRAERSLSDNEPSCSLCFSMVLAVTTFDHSSMGQPFAHSPSSQMNFKVEQLPKCLDASESSAGSFHLPLLL